MQIIRTTILLTLLTVIFLFFGFLLGGMTGAFISLIFAVLINFSSYWYSDKIVLKIYKAKPYENEKINLIIENLSNKANLPKPKLYIVNMTVPNAFATGRNPENGVIAVTSGLINTLNEDEIEGVLAHEMAHIKNRDTLISTMSATIAGAISFLAQFAWYSMFFNRNEKNFALLPLLILAPIAAVIVQLAISRSREFTADYIGAKISGKPLNLASALGKISKISRHRSLTGNSATSHMWIINPFKADGFTKLFSTHPSTQERCKRLRQM